MWTTQTNWKFHACIKYIYMQRGRERWRDKFQHNKLALKWFILTTCYFLRAYFNALPLSLFSGGVALKRPKVTLRSFPNFPDVVGWLTGDRCYDSVADVISPQSSRLLQTQLTRRWLRGRAATADDTAARRKSKGLNQESPERFNADLWSPLMS